MHKYGFFIFFIFSKRKHGLKKFCQKSKNSVQRNKEIKNIQVSLYDMLKHSITYFFFSCMRYR